MNFKKLIFLLKIMLIISNDLKVIEVETEENGEIKSINPSETEEYKIINKSCIQLKKKPEVIIPLITLKDINYEPVRNFKNITKIIRKLKDHDLISNQSFAIKDNKLYFGGLKENLLKKEYKERIGLTLNLELNSQEYSFPLFNIRLNNPLSETTIKCLNYEELNGNFILKSDKPFAVAAPLLNFNNLIYNLSYFKECDLISLSEKQKTPSHIHCSKFKIEELKTSVPDFVFEIGNYKFIPKRENLFDNELFFIYRGNDLDKWNFFGSLCENFVFVFDAYYKKLNIYFNVNEVKGFNIQKGRDYAALWKLNYFYIFLIFIFVLFLFVGKQFFKKNNYKNDNEEELVSL